MRGLAAAIADSAASLTAWPNGLYGWMATDVSVIFQRDLPLADMAFGFRGQSAMSAIFLAHYMVNGRLARSGEKVQSSRRERHAAERRALPRAYSQADAVSST